MECSALRSNRLLSLTAWELMRRLRDYFGYFYPIFEQKMQDGLEAKGSRSLNLLPCYELRDVSVGCLTVRRKEIVQRGELGR